MQGFSTYDDLLDEVEQSDHEYRSLGWAPDGSPMIAVEAGGEAGPPVLVTAGAHATEHAGVRAAVELLSALDTDRRVYVVPTRDPVGLNGYAYPLQQAMDAEVAFDTFAELDDALEDEGETIHRNEEMTLTLVGDTGFATTEPSDDLSSCLSLLTTLKDHAASDSDLLEPFRGRRIYAPAGHPDVEETSDFGRAYTFVISPDGEFLHLNRFFDRPWAPTETRCVRRLFAEIDPVLTLDLHESSRQGDRYHVSLRPMQTDDQQSLETEIGRNIASDVAAEGIPLATDDDIFGSTLDVVGHSSDDDGDPNERFYSRETEGVYRVDPNATAPPRRGEGLNLPDYAAEHDSLAFTVETGMHGSFEDRVTAAVMSVQTAIDTLPK